MSRTSDLVGPRRPARTVTPAEALRVAETLSKVAGQTLGSARSISEMKNALAPACRAYYTLAAVSRRRVISDMDRRQLLGAVFAVRAVLERAIEAKLWAIDESVATAVSGAFFGSSAKQGVGIRYALASCVPTTTCGGRCYAHDGRDRELHHLFRAALNWHVGRRYEEGSDGDRLGIMGSLEPAIGVAISAARMEASRAAQKGYIRAPRIRFSHIGDMAATPKFTNGLATAIKTQAPDVSCVMYTRHPAANQLDPTLFVINFSIDGDDDPRLRLAPSGARIVCSAWNGTVAQSAQVNFLEHHVEKVFIQVNAANVCPVTARHGEVASCDEATCDTCFENKA